MSWLLDKWFGVDDEEKRAAELDAKLAALNRQKLEEGKVSQDLFDTWEANRIKAGADGLGGDAEFSDDIDQAFMEGMDEGADNIRGLATDTINTVVGTPLKIIPWQIWLAAGLYLAWHLGLFKGIMKKAR